MSPGQWFLWILRAIFVLAAVGAGVAVMLHPAVYYYDHAWLVVVGVLLVAIGFIALDVMLPRKRIELVTSIYFGLLVGLFLTYVVGIALLPLFEGYGDLGVMMREAGMIVVGTIICYLCISLLWQTKDDFRFIIPYIEFSRDVKGLKPYVLDTSVVIDGRIADFVETGAIDNQIIMPRFVLNELQNIADSSDRMRRTRGRRGLDVLTRLRNSERVELKIYETELPEMHGQPVDMKLVILARHLQGKVVTGDFNLNKVAKLQNVPVINLNEVANSLKPVFLPGEQIEVKIVKPGEEPGQGIAYLDDGTMVVVEEGRDSVGSQVKIVVTSMLQTNAGRMIFGRVDRSRNSAD